MIDTNVLVAGLGSRNGASYRILRHVAEKRLKPLVTIGLFLEYEAVLKRSEQREVQGFSETDLDVFMREFAALSEPVEVHFLWRPQLSDPADELVLEAAVNGRAEAIVTHNVRDFAKASRFGVEVLMPSGLIGSKESELGFPSAFWHASLSHA